MKYHVLTIFALLISLNLVSAVVVNFVDISPISPGQEGTIRFELENILSNDVEDVTLSLDFTDKPFIPIGSSQQSVDEIQDDEDEEFAFRIRASQDLAPGQYEIPYTITYEDQGDEKTRIGTIGIQVTGNPDLTFTVNTEIPVVGRQGQITVRAINKGFADARFVALKVFPEGMTLLSEDEVYIGEIESDDFETANFDVLFTDTDARVTVLVQYKDFNNEQVIQNIEIPVQVYTSEQALSLGLIQPNRVVYYIIFVILIIVLIVLWRWMKKRQRLKRSMQNKG